MLHDVLIVFEQQFRWQVSQVEQLCREGMMEMVDVVLAQSFQLLVAEMLGQVLEALYSEER
jgi:hypothetical protein